jgi:hypothetical protein
MMMNKLEWKLYSDNEVGAKSAQESASNIFLRITSLPKSLGFDYMKCH